MSFNNIGALQHIDLSEPTKCEECGSTDIKYEGIGEYRCKDCGCIMYDDYGKVRNYIEKNVGATVNDVSIAVGVTREKIRRLLREDKIQIAPESMTFLKCEMCGANIRSGRFCEKCAQEVNRTNKAAEMANRRSAISGGYSKLTGGDSGAKRFDRK